MDQGLTEDGDYLEDGQQEEEEDDLFSGVTSGYYNEDGTWPGEDEEESDIDSDEERRRLLPLRKVRNKPIVLLELSDIESLREGAVLDQASLDDDDMSGLELTMSEAMSIGTGDKPRRKKKSLRTPEFYLNAILNMPALYDRIYSFLHAQEEAYAHRRISQSFCRRFSKRKVKVQVQHYLPRFLRFASELKSPMPESMRFAIEGPVTREELALVGKIISKNMVPGLEDIALLTDVETDNRYFTSFFQCCEAAPPTTRIQSFDFCGSYLGDDAVRCFLQVLRKCAFPMLKSLCLSRCNMTWLIIKYLAETLTIRMNHLVATPVTGRKAMPKCEPIVDLDLSRNPLQESLHFLFPQHVPCALYASLARLNLSDSFLEAEDLSPLTEALRRLCLRSLTHLLLSNNNHLGDHATSSLLSVLASQPKACPLLVHLDMSNTTSGIALATSLSSALRVGALPLLTHLDLSYNLLAHDGTSHLCEAMKLQCCPKLTYLSLACNRLKDQGMHTISRCLATGAGTSLTTLDLSINEIAGSVQNLARVINSRVCPDLRHLALSGNSFDLGVITTLFVPRVRRRVIID